jgi:hypothetical protein
MRLIGVVALVSSVAGGVNAMVYAWAGATRIKETTPPAVIKRPILRLAATMPSNLAAAKEAERRAIRPGP